MLFGDARGTITGLQFEYPWILLVIGSALDKPPRLNLSALRPTLTVAVPTTVQPPFVSYLFYNSYPILVYDLIAARLIEWDADEWREQSVQPSMSSSVPLKQCEFSYCSTKISLGNYIISNRSADDESTAAVGPGGDVRGATVDTRSGRGFISVGSYSNPCQFLIGFDSTGGRRS